MATFKKRMSQDIEVFSKLLYPWLYPKFSSLRNLFLRGKVNNFHHKRGIVIPCGEAHFNYTIHLIVTLQTVIKTVLPIEVHHAGPKDLPEHMRHALHSLGVTTVDLWDYFGEEAKALVGWAIKPFAILASSFQEVVLVDGDSLFLQDPNTIFETSKLYRQFGTLFFTDRTQYSPGWEMYSNRFRTHWFKSFTAFPSLHASQNRLLRGLSRDDMESGVIFVNKNFAGNLFGLLSACKMNTKTARELTYARIHGNTFQTFPLFFNSYFL
jgi:hypothetical protein